MPVTGLIVVVEPECGDKVLLSIDDADALVLIAAIWLACSQRIGIAYLSLLQPSLHSNCVVHGH